MTPDPQDVTPGELRRWLGRVDARVDGLDAKVATLDRDIRDRLDRIDKVTREEWKDAREADQRYAAETRRMLAEGDAEVKKVAIEEAAGAKKLIFLVATLLLSVLGIVSALIQVAGG